MSNTIRKPRKRPRVKSCSFRTLWWLIRREAAWNILAWNYSEFSREKGRVEICNADTQWLDRRAAYETRRWPSRRYYP